MSVVGVIPARMSSTRLPGKLLLAETGQPLIQHTWEMACRVKLLDQILIATDSGEIAKAVRAFGGRCEMTGDHPSGTDRIAEVARRCLPNADMIVNIQGDEPDVDPAHIDTMVESLLSNPAVDMATLATPIRTQPQLDDPSCVKVVRAQDGRALYFSRLPIPFCRDKSPELLLHQTEPPATHDNQNPQLSPWLLHLGLYAYRREFLLQLAQLPPSPLEQLEKLEQLRALECGAAIQVEIVDQPSVGIDTPDDYARFVAEVQRRAA